MSIQIVSFTTKKSESVGRLLAAFQQDDYTLKYGCGLSKLEQYQYFNEKGLSSIEHTTDVSVAEGWQAQGHTVMCRKTVHGQTGSGIVVCSPNDILPEAKVYTKYISHKREFRVNLFKGKVVNVREKKRKLGSTGDFHIRNLANGYTTTKCFNYPEALVVLAEAASKASESDFVGADIGFNELKNKAFLIEINSGPAIEGSSVADFVNAIKADMNV